MVPKHHGDALDEALELRLFDALREGASLDQIELSKILGVSRATVQRCFKRLLRAGKVVRVGGKRFGHWEVIG
jgi:ATP-dependent DNA helicase RecG